MDIEAFLQSGNWKSISDHFLKTHGHAKWAQNDLRLVEDYLRCGPEEAAKRYEKTERHHRILNSSGEETARAGYAVFRAAGDYAHTHFKRSDRAGQQAFFDLVGTMLDSSREQYCAHDESSPCEALPRFMKVALFHNIIEMAVSMYRPIHQNFHEELKPAALFTLLREEGLHGPLAVLNDTNNIIDIMKSARQSYRREKYLLQGGRKQYIQAHDGMQGNEYMPYGTHETPGNVIDILTPRMENLSRRNDEIIRMVSGFYQEFGHAPALQDLSELMDISVSTLSRHMHEIRERLLAGLDMPHLGVLFEISACTTPDARRVQSQSLSEQEFERARQLAPQWLATSWGERVAAARGETGMDRE